MNLTRTLEIPACEKRLRNGPCAGGTFWALGGLIAYPAEHRVARADAGYLLKHGDLYFQPTTQADAWVKAGSLDDLRQFRRIVVDGSLVDGTGYVTALPFLPEFYYVPRSWRGRRAVERAHRRACTRNPKRGF